MTAEELDQYAKRMTDQPKNWKPGDSPVAIDDSDIVLPSDVELQKALETAEHKSAN
jgi:hypothetical protein